MQQGIDAPDARQRCGDTLRRPCSGGDVNGHEGGVVGVALGSLQQAARTVNLDGELRTQTPVVFKRAQRAVKMFVPQTRSL